MYLNLRHQFGHEIQKVGSCMSSITEHPEFHNLPISHHNKLKEDAFIGLNFTDGSLMLFPRPKIFKFLLNSLPNIVTVLGIVRKITRLFIFRNSDSVQRSKRIIVLPFSFRTNTIRSIIECAAGYRSHDNQRTAYFNNKLIRHAPPCLNR